MIILLGAIKGGSGKSTLAVSLSALLAGQGHDVVLVDADRQASAATWAADREGRNDVPPVSCVQKYGDITKTLLDLNKRYSHVVVDCAGHNSEELRCAMLAANVMLSPFRASQLDVDSAPKVADLIDQAKPFNKKLKCYAVLTVCPTNPANAEINDARLYLSQVKQFKVIEPVIYDRKAYRDCISAGLGVSETKNDKAQKEIESLWGAING